MLAFDLQGGGLLVYGTATLTNSNIYSNSAVDALVRTRLSVTFHRPNEMLHRLLVFLRAGRGALHHRHGNADQLKRVRKRGTGICALAF